jgi:hypothetical protein
MSEPDFFKDERWLDAVLRRERRAAALAVIRTAILSAPDGPSAPEADEPTTVLARPAANGGSADALT